MSEYSQISLELIRNMQEAVLDIEADAENPFFSSKFVSLANILNKIAPVLKEANAILVQSVDTDLVDGVVLHSLVTTIQTLDSNKPVIKMNYPLSVKSQEPQAMGAAVTYARRYTLYGLLNIVASGSDDVGESTLELPLEKRTSAEKLIEIGKMLQDKGISSRADRVRLIDMLAGKTAYNTSAVNRLKRAIEKATPETLLSILETGEI